MNNLQDLLERYQDQEKMYSFEMERGVRQFEKVIAVLGYDNNFGGYLHNFFADNSGAIEAVLNWIGKQKSPEWKEMLENEIIPDEESEEEEED